MIDQQTNSDQSTEINKIRSDYAENAQANSSFEKTKTAKVSFRDTFLTNESKSLLTLRNTHSSYSNKPSPKEILFLNQNEKIVNINEKKNEYGSMIKNLDVTGGPLFNTRRVSYHDVKVKLNQNRNKNIENLLKDVRLSKSGLVEQMQTDLKLEFRNFLDESAQNGAMKLKKISNQILTNQSNFNKKKKMSLTDTDKNEHKIPKENSWNFLTQNNQEEELEQLKEMKEEDASPGQTVPKLEINDKKTPIPHASSLKIKQYDSNMQIALIEDDWNVSSAIKLKKMLDGIKRIDLPKFQPEIHQICQYGGDPDLLKLYPEDLESNNLSDKQNSLGRYCVHECCIRGNAVMLKALLPHVDDLNKLDQNNQNAAHICAKYGELDCLKILTANGIKLDAFDSFGMDLSHIASRYNHKNILEYLFNIGYRLDTSSLTEGKLPIHYAAEFGAYEALVLLSQYYVDLSIKDNDGNTAAHLAAKNDKLNCLKFLVKFGLPVDRLNNNLGRNVTHVCCLNGSINCLHWLFEFKKTDINALDDYGNNLAHSACISGHAECFNCCIQHDVDINYLNKNEENCIDLSRRYGKYLLIEKALKNEITCPHCVKKALKIKWQIENQNSIGERTIEKNRNKMYRVDPNLSIINRTKKNESVTSNIDEEYYDSLKLKRDFIAQFFGPDM